MFKNYHQAFKKFQMQDTVHQTQRKRKTYTSKCQLMINNLAVGLCFNSLLISIAYQSFWREHSIYEAHNKLGLFGTIQTFVDSPRRMTIVKCCHESHAEVRACSLHVSRSSHVEFR
jgi:hypothetical protein